MIQIEPIRADARLEKSRWGRLWLVQQLLASHRVMPGGQQTSHNLGGPASWTALKKPARQIYGKQSSRK
jgi:hypothetical protein